MWDWVLNLNCLFHEILLLLQITSGQLWLFRVGYLAAIFLKNEWRLSFQGKQLNLLPMIKIWASKRKFWKTWTHHSELTAFSNKICGGSTKCHFIVISQNVSTFENLYIAVNQLFLQTSKAQFYKKARLGKRPTQSVRKDQ